MTDFKFLFTITSDVKNLHFEYNKFLGAFL